MMRVVVIVDRVYVVGRREGVFDGGCRCEWEMGECGGEGWFCCLFIFGVLFLFILF